MPAAVAMVRVNQWVRPGGFCCVVFSITSRTIATEIAGSAPGPACVTFQPSNACLEESPTPARRGARHHT